MNETLTLFTYKTRSGLNANDRPWIYFAGSMDMYEKWFPLISEDIWTIHKRCAIWFHDWGIWKKMSVSEQFDFSEEIELALGQMQIFILPITESFLKEEYFEDSIEWKLVIEMHIPILPILLEEGLDEEFNRRFGNIQFLIRNNRDTTGISYEEKLKKFIEQILISDEERNEIRSAFSARMFLSYRQINRLKARKVMRRIHEIHDLRYLAIWYDEYLTPGKPFDEQIERILNDCDLFSIVVTSDLLTFDNYVVTTEYPMALRLEKPIVPFLVEKIDKKALKSCFSQLKEYVDPDDERALLGSLLPYVESYSDSSDVNLNREYLLGLAFLTGTEVEKSNSIGFEMIHSAALREHPKACKRLAQMYQTGEAVAVDYDKSIYWFLRFKCILEEYFIENPEEWFRELLEAYWDLGDLLTVNGNLSDANEVFYRMQQISEQILEEPFVFSKESLVEVDRYLAVSFQKQSDIEIQLDHLENGKKLLDQSLVLWEERNERFHNVETVRDVCVALSKLGDICISMGNHKEAADYYLSFLKMEEWLIEIAGKQNLLRDLLVAYHKVGDCLRLARKGNESLKYLKKSLEISEILVKEEDTQESVRDYAISLYKIGEVFLEQYLPGDALEYFEQASELIGDELKKGENIGWMYDKSVCDSKLCDTYLELGRVTDAKDSSKAFLMVSEKLVSLNKNVKNSRILSIAYEKFADIQLLLGDMEAAKEAFFKCKDIRKELRIQAETSQHLLDEGIIWGKLGDFYNIQGNLEQAEVCYAAYICNMRKAVEQDDSVEVKENLAMSLGKMSECLLGMERFSDCEKLCLEAVEIYHRLLPNCDSQRMKYNMSVVYENLIDVYSGQQKEPFEWISRCIQIRRELTETNPSIRNLCALATAYEKDGDYAFKVEQLEKARERYLDSRLIREQLVDGAQDPDRLRELATIYNKTGLLFRAKEDIENAKLYLLNAYKIREILVKNQATIKDYDQMGVSMYFIGTLGGIQKDILIEARNIYMLLKEHMPMNSKYQKMIDLIDKLL